MNRATTVDRGVSFPHPQRDESRSYSGSRGGLVLTIRGKLAHTNCTEQRATQAEGTANDPAANTGARTTATQFPRGEGQRGHIAFTAPCAAYFFRPSDGGVRPKWAGR